MIVPQIGWRDTWNFKLGRAVGEKGRIVIPAEMRKALGIG